MKPYIYRKGETIVETYTEQLVLYDGCVQNAPIPKSKYPINVLNSEPCWLDALEHLPSFFKRIAAVGPPADNLWHPLFISC